MESVLSALLTTAATCKMSSTATLVGAFPTVSVAPAVFVSMSSRVTAPALPLAPWSTTTAVPSAESIATAIGCVPTEIGGFGAGGMFVADGVIATFTEADAGEPLGTSLFCTSIGKSPGVEKENPGDDNVTCNWRLLPGVEGRIWLPDVTCVDDEKYPPFKLSVPEIVDGGKLSGMDAITVGRVG